MPFKIGPLELVLMIPVFLIGLALYFAPTIIASFRKHPNALGIFLLNFLLGWTLLGWIGALIWSLMTPGTTIGANKNALELAKERYARGEISQAEFDEIKQNLK